MSSKRAEAYRRRFNTDVVHEEAPKESPLAKAYKRSFDNKKSTISVGDTALPTGVQGPVQNDRPIREALKQVPSEEQGDYLKTLQRQYPTMKDNVKSLANEVVTGLSNAGTAVWKTIDFLTLDELTSKIWGTKNKTSEFFDWIYAGNAAQNAKQAELRANADKWAAKLGEYVVQPVMQAAPNAIIAGMSGGASLAGNATSLGGSAATTSGTVAGMAATSAKELIKNPSFWVSFAQTAGPTYFDAKENGANELEATATALLNAFAGSAIEVGGGIETLPNTPMGVKQWVKSALEEGGEEVLQGITEGVVHKAVYDADREWASWTDPDAVVSGTRAVQEYAGGVVVGGVLGGAQIGVAAAAESVKNYAGFVQIGKSYLNAENGQTIDDALRIGLSNAKGTEWYRAAETIQQKNTDALYISPYAVGRMVVGSFTTAAQTARTVDTQVRDSARTFGVDEQTADAVARVAVATSTPIEFVSPTALQVAGENGVSIAEGRYVDGKVQLNASMPAEQLTGYLLAHELTHSIQDTAQWRQLERLVHSYYGDAAFESAISAVTEKYAKNNTTLSRDGAVREVVAQWVGQNLFRQGFAQAIIDGDATVGNAFLQVLDKVRLALGGTKNSRTASNIALVERLFMRALENRQTTVADDSAYSLEYQRADQNEDILHLVERVKRGEYKDNDFVSLGIVDEKAANRIREITGVDVRGWSVKIEARQIKHILNRHGENGAADSSLADIADIAKMEYVLGDADAIVDGGTSTAYTNFVNGKNRLAKTVLYQKDLGGKYYYIVQAVPDTKRHTLYVDSAYINKTKKVEPAYSVDAKSPGETSENVSIGNSTDTTIPQNGTGVNSYDMQNGGENSQFSFWDGSDTDIFGTSAGEATPIGNETAAAEAETFAANADDIAVGHGQATVSPSRGQAAPAPFRQGGWENAANSQAIGNLETAHSGDAVDAESVMADVEAKVAESKQQKFTKAMQKHDERRAALLQDHKDGRISDADFLAEMRNIEQDAIRENDKKWSTGKRGTAAEKQHASNAVKTYAESTNTRLSQRQRAVETAEQRSREKRMAKKCTEIRRSIHTTVDELAAKLARPSKNRFIPPDLVSGMQDLLALFEETPESIDNRVWELKKKILEATDEGKKARLQKRLDNLQNRNRLARENVHKIKIAYGKFCEEMSYGGEQHKFAVQKIKEELDKLSDALFDTELDDMSYEDLRNVFNVVRGVAFQVNNAQKLFCAEHRGELQEQGELGIDELLDAVAFYDKGLLHFNGIKKLVNWQLTPDRFFKMLGGFKKDSVWERVYNSFKEGQKRYFAIQREFDEFFKEFTEDKAFKHLADFKEKHLVDVGLKDKNGKPVMLTRGMMLSLYMHLVCNMETVIWSGLEIPALKTYYEYGITKDAYKNGTRVTRSEFCDKLWELTEQMKMTQDPTEQSRIQEELAKTAVLAQQSFENILQNIRGELTAYETKFIEKAEKWFNEISKNHINETTTQVFGYPKAMVQRYFRIRRDTDFVDTEIAGLAYNQTIESMGPLQARVKSNTPMLLTDLMDELTANCNDVARIVGFMAPETDFRRLYNVHDKNMQHSVKEVLRQFGSERGVGVSANQYIENLLTDLTFGRKFEQGPLGWLYRNSVRAVMTLNPRVAMIQLAAGPTSASVLGWKTWAKGAKYLFKKPPIDKINKHSIYGYVRNNADGGMQEFSVARQRHGVIDHLYNFVDDKTNGWFFGWCQKVDQGLVNSLWFTSEEKIRETRPDLKEGTEEYYQAVGEMLDEVIIKTQSNGTTLEKPDLLRNKSAIMKLFTMFKTDTMQQFNILFEGHMTLKRALTDFKAGKATKADVREAKGKYANAVTGAIVGGMAFAMIMRALANCLLKNTDKYRDEDGEVTASSVALAATNEMLGSMAGLVTFGDYIYEVVAAQVFNERYYGISDMGLETASELLSTFANADFSDGKTWKKLFFNFTDVVGIPADNVRKMVEALNGHIKDIENGEFLKLNTASESTVSQYYSRLYKALRDGDTARAERARNALRGLGKSDAEILTGMRAAIRKADDKQQKGVFDDMFADMRATGLYNRLTEEEKQKVQSGIKGYIADVMLADITGEKMTAAHQKAEKYAKRGVPEADYFLAQVVKDAFFADKDKDGDVSRAEYAEALEDGAYTARIRAMLLGLKK